MTSELEFVPCTIHTAIRGDIPGFEAVGTGLGYYTVEEKEGEPSFSYLIHLQSGVLVVSIETYDEKYVRAAIIEILGAKFVDWRQDQTVINLSVKREQVDALRTIVRKHEVASLEEAEKNSADFEINFTVTGRMLVHTTNRHQAKRIATQVLEEFEVDNPEVEDYYIISASID